MLNKIGIKLTLNEAMKTQTHKNWRCAYTWLLRVLENQTLTPEEIEELDDIVWERLSDGTPAINASPPADGRGMR